MRAKPLFMDSGGFYALISPASPFHELAVGIMREAAQHRRRAVTTDYIVDEFRRKLGETASAKASA